MKGKLGKMKLDLSLLTVLLVIVVLVLTIVLVYKQSEGFQEEKKEKGENEKKNEIQTLKQLREEKAIELEKVQSELNDATMKLAKNISNNSSSLKQEENVSAEFQQQGQNSPCDLGKPMNVATLGDMVACLEMNGPKMMNQGMMNQGMMNREMMNQEMMNQEMMNQEMMNQNDK